MKRLLAYFPYYAACIALASMLWRSPTILLFSFIVLSISMLWRWHDVDDLVFYGLPFVLGPLGEMVAIYHGAWQYSRPYVLVPLWLPLAWGCAGLYMKKTAYVLIAHRRARSAKNVPSALTMPESA